MTKEDRRVAVLRFYAETSIAMPPKVAYLNLKYRGATFSENTAQRHIREMHSEGLLEKFDLHDGYYQITNRGREYLRGSTN